MFVELQDIVESDNFDYCIVGSGPAGITCARALSSPNKKILLLEGGGRKYTVDSQDVYRGVVVGDPYYALDYCRLRYFGGTSNHWGGWCRPLDEIDFEAKDGFPKTRWPIGKKHLDSYLEVASSILDVRPLHQDVELSGGLVKQVDVAITEPVRFSEKYGSELLNSQSIAAALNAYVLELKTNGKGITAVGVVDSQGTRRGVSANKYILACGGIENSRLLLWSNHKANNQIIKNSTTLGRYWMEHPHCKVGDAILNNDMMYPFNNPANVPPSPNREDRSIVFFAPTNTAILKSNILNCRLRFERKNYHGAKQLIANLACEAPNLAEKFFTLLGKNLVCGVEIFAAWEQEPIAENCIELSGDTDRFGVPRPILYWKKSNSDLKTVRTVSQLLGEQLAGAHIGRLRLRPWVVGKESYPDDDELAGCHHMGGTRMSDTPDDGIVDLNCKVFGLANLYIAGSSVFPSVGYTNPTLTIVQLALRLADHLRSLGTG